MSASSSAWESSASSRTISAVGWTCPVLSVPRMPRKRRSICRALNDVFMSTSIISITIGGERAFPVFSPLQELCHTGLLVCFLVIPAPAVWGPS